MRRPFAYAALAAIVLAGAVALDLHRSAAALMKGEVYYVEMGIDCPPGWRNRSAHADLIAAYAPSPDKAGYDMCVGGV